MSVHVAGIVPNAKNYTWTFRKKLSISQWSYYLDQTNELEILLQHLVPLKYRFYMNIICFMSRIINKSNSMFTPDKANFSCSVITYKVNVKTIDGWC